jgi:hypothetical protein
MFCATQGEYKQALLRYTLPHLVQCLFCFNLETANLIPTAGPQVRTEFDTAPVGTVLWGLSGQEVGFKFIGF